MQRTRQLPLTAAVGEYVAFYVNYLMVLVSRIQALSFPCIVCVVACIMHVSFNSYIIMYAYAYIFEWIWLECTQ